MFCAPIVYNKVVTHSRNDGIDISFLASPGDSGYTAYCDLKARERIGHDT